MKPVLATSLGMTLALAACGGSDAPGPLFQPEPECEGDAVQAFHGDHAQVIASLAIGTPDEGFDLDGDGMPDNKLGAAAGIARTPIKNALDKYDIIIPFEFFDLPAVAADDCVKFAIYLGIFKHDGDGDGQDTAISGGDCDDTRASSGHGQPELPGNYLDDNCDGRADEDAGGNPSTDADDHDGDHVTIADGDCDDSVETGAHVHPGAVEICDDGLDNDCDGIADRGPDGSNPCDPFATVQTVDVDPRSLDQSGAPSITFTNGTIDAQGHLTAGPSLFEVSLPIVGDTALDLRLTGAQIVADLVDDGGGKMHLANGHLAGIIDARTADEIKGLSFPQINLTPDESLLDAAFANLLGTYLALPFSTQVGFTQCQTPDIDVDLDGLETFCDSTPGDDMKHVDTCIDGDGTVVHDGDDGVADCSAAVDANGKPRFVDGISVELDFTTSATKIAAGGG
jgi:hypothetical protein